MMDVTIAVVSAITSVAMAYLGVHLAIHPPEMAEAKRSYKRGFVSLGLASVILIGVQAYRSDIAMKDLPREVAEYIRNTAPPQGYFSRLRVAGPPDPPTGLVAIVDGQTSVTVSQIAHRILDFLNSQGDAPKQKIGESDLDFVSRSNAWYGAVMGQYNSQYAAQVVTITQLLAEKKLLEPSVAEIAKNPINPLGVKVIATKLQETALGLALQERTEAVSIK
jgi:hypothetical protein